MILRICDKVNKNTTKTKTENLRNSVKFIDLHISSAAPKEKS